MKQYEIQTLHSYVDIFNPDPNTIDIRDIAHGLAYTCRFRGFTKRFYSVAQHSYNVSVVLESSGLGRMVILAGLMHDAAEAYMGDMPTPHKRYFDEFRQIEEHLQAVISDKFCQGLQFFGSVHLADEAMLHIEAKELLPSPTWVIPRYVTPSIDLTPWSVEMAERFFLIRFRELMNGTR